MGILSWIIVGAIAGWLAGFVMKGRGYGLIKNIVIGIIGAIVGGWGAGALFGINDAVTGINLTTIIVSSIGAIAILFIVRIIRR